MTMYESTFKPLKQQIQETIEIDPVKGCWLWKGTLSTAGYATIKGKLAHRAAYEAYVGVIPRKMFVCHHCDTRNCVNPEHLFIETARGNIGDMIAKGRGYGPTKTAKKALTPAEVEEVKRFRKEGVKYRVLSDMFGLSQGSLHEIVNGRNKGPKSDDGPRAYRSLFAREKKALEDAAIPEKPKKIPTSKFKGVHINKTNGSICANYKGKYLGSFKDEVSAALAYDKAVTEDLGEYAVTNAMLGNYFGPDEEPEDM